jgi:hypothetical protein
MRSYPSVVVSAHIISDFHRLYQLAEPSFGRSPSKNPSFEEKTVMKKV